MKKSNNPAGRRITRLCASNPGQECATRLQLERDDNHKRFESIIDKEEDNLDNYMPLNKSHTSSVKEGSTSAPIFSSPAPEVEPCIRRNNSDETRGAKDATCPESFSHHYHSQRDLPTMMNDLINLKEKEINPTLGKSLRTITISFMEKKYVLYLHFFLS